MKVVSKLIPKLFNLLICWFPVIITFGLADNGIIPFGNTTLLGLEKHVCEPMNTRFPYAPFNFGVTFLFMLLPTFLMVNIPFLPKMNCSYETFETLLYISILIYKATADGLFFGFSIAGGESLELSSSVWILSFVFAKTMSKLANSEFGTVICFWTIFISYAVLFDPFFFGFYINVLAEARLFIAVVVMEIAWSRWKYRRFLPIPIMLSALMLYVIASFFSMVLLSDRITCTDMSSFFFLPAARSMISLGLFLFFIGFRKQEKDSKKGQRSFQEVDQEGDGDQLI